MNITYECPREQSNMSKKLLSIDYNANNTESIEMIIFPLKYTSIRMITTVGVHYSSDPFNQRQPKTLTQFYNLFSCERDAMMP